MQDGGEFIQPNINVLIRKWIPCDMLWMQLDLYGNYVTKC
jgi:hypothetical protein